MTFIAVLRSPYDVEAYERFNEGGYTVIFHDDLVNDLVALEKEDGSVAELMEIDIVLEARVESRGKLDT